jgi:hypothetical protein
MLSFVLFLLLQGPPPKPAPQVAPAQTVAAPAPVQHPEPPKVEAPTLEPAPQPAPTPAPRTLLQVKKVYLLQMGTAFDQYLASWITRDGVIHVVTDPAKADAIFTDRIGKGFEAKMEELYPETKPEPKQVKKEKPPEGAEDEKQHSSTSFDVHSAPQERMSTGGRGKGTFFLVDRGSRHVIWSTYVLPKTMRSSDLDAAAKEVAATLLRAIKKQKQDALKPASDDK